MGMFDNLKVEEIPGFPGDPTEVGWQTKTIQQFPAMDTFRIENGRLEKRFVEREETGEMLEISDEIPKREIVDEWWEDTNYHGTFTFYSTYPGADYREWFEYEAKFTDGELEQIERVEG